MSFTKKVKEVVYNRYKYWKIRQRIPDEEYARFIQQHWIDYDHLEWDSSNKALRVKGIDLSITKEKSAFLLTPYNQVAELLLLQKELGAHFYQEQNELYAKFDDLVLNIQTREELLIIREIYLEGIYGFIPATKFIALDIGMNVGFSSLYFARHPLCEKVYSFEPFTPTYKQAIFNIGNNPALKDKIQTFNFGLSDSDTSFEIDYSPSNRGSMSIDYTPDFLQDMSDMRKEKIAVRDVGQVFAELGIGSQPDRQVVAKIDCEGAEYAILERLAQNGFLSNIDIVMMEWHLKGAEPLLECLDRFGFTCFSMKPFDKYQGKFGFIYGVRKGSGKNG